jgi:hypothetical protein
MAARKKPERLVIVVLVALLVLALNQDPGLRHLVQPVLHWLLLM